MNYMSEVTKMLGVELGEEFYVKELPDVKCTFYNDSLYVYPIRDALCSLPSGEHVLGRLLAGTITIKRKPWKPKTDECYYFVDENGTVHSTDWCDIYEDITFYKLGNCYRTKEEAEANRDKWITFYASDEVLDV